MQPSDPQLVESVGRRASVSIEPVTTTIGDPETGRHYSEVRFGLFVGGQREGVYVTPFSAERAAQSLGFEVRYAQKDV